MEKKNTLLITGANGFVGSELARLLRPHMTVFTPTRLDLDITDNTSVSRYMNAHHPDVVIHAAAFTDNKQAESERGDINGLCYKTNVIGTRHIAQCCRATGAFLTYISTGSVFGGVKSNPGPFTDCDPVSALERVSWYGFTKSEAEKQISDGAIIRISHPISGHPNDYLMHMISLFDTGSLYPLYTDQQFPITDINILSKLIIDLQTNRRGGIFHSVSYDCVSPYNLFMYAMKQFRGIKPQVTTIQFSESGAAYGQYSALQLSDTLRRWNSVYTYSWKDVLRNIKPA